MDEMRGKFVLIERVVNNTTLIYRGKVLEVTDAGVWIDDIKVGKMFFPFTQVVIKEINEVR